MNADHFESSLLAVMGFFALILVACLASLAFSSWRRRRASPFHSAEFRRAHVQPTQKAAPTVATLISRSEAPTVEAPRFRSRAWERQTNHGMY